MPVSKDEVKDLLSERTSMYEFLSKIYFKELPEAAIEALQTEFDAVELDGANANINGGIEMLQRYFQFSGSDKRTELATEYARIFLSAGVYTQTRVVAAPYESVFTSEEHLMVQDARDEVRRIFLRDGFVVDPELHEPEDHLSFELEYIGALSAQALAFADSGDAAALRENLGKQLTFINKHLLNWLPDLLQTAKEFAKLTFYLGILLFTQGYLEDDVSFLQELLDLPEAIV